MDTVIALYPDNISAKFCDYCSSSFAVIGAQSCDFCSLISWFLFDLKICY